MLLPTTVHCDDAHPRARCRWAPQPRRACPERGHGARVGEAISWSLPTPSNPPPPGTTSPQSRSPYADLEIAEGATAAVELERLLSRGDAMTAAERQHLRDALLRYCAFDTMSMVRLLERLRELA